MKCKSCGGELRFQDGVCICQSCGVTFTLDSIYENIDVCICYEETDSAGRRTKDSIIAQEVYRKLQENKIETFYERISADGLIGRNLEESKLAAIHRAQAIIVLGTSIDNFSAIETKYGEYFAGKVIIPFCVDINPNAIPKTLSKVQAMNYSTIGWDKDLIKGINNILGKEQAVDTGSLYGHRKRKIIAITVIAVIVAVAIFVAGWFLVNSDEKSKNTETSTPSIESTVETTEKPLSQKEIYDNAAECLDQGSFVEALELFAQIPDYPNSANMVKQIYSKYEGYYQNGNTTFHLEITDNTRADIEISIRGEENVIKIVESAEIQINKLSCDYLDNHQASGKIELSLENAGLQLVRIESESNNKNELFFDLSEKSDQPIVQIDAETLLNWVRNANTYSQLIALGYEFEEVENMTSMEFPDDENKLLKLKDTDIYLSMIKFYYDGTDEHWFDDRVVAAVAAPARLVAPSLVGEGSLPVLKDDCIYWPNGYLHHYSTGYFASNYFENSGTAISDDTVIGIVTKTTILKSEWSTLTKSIFEERVRVAAEPKYGDSEPDGYVDASIYGENNTHYLVKVISSRLDTTQCAWYKIHKQDKVVVFMAEGPDTYHLSNADQVYPDIVREFPSAFGSTSQGTSPDTDVSYLVKVRNDGYNIYNAPSYNSEVVQSIPIGTYTIVAEQIDADGKTWGKLKSGLGWICVSDIQA